MRKWLNLFMENEIVNRSDKSDRFDLGVNLSGRPQGLLDEKKVENNLRKGGDKSDRFKFESNMSPLSLRTPGLLNENLEKVENNPRKGGDKSARFKLRANMSPLSLRSQGLLDENLEKVGNNSRKRGDKSARFKLSANMSPNEEGVLSAPTQEPLDQNLGERSRNCVKSYTLRPKLSLPSKYT